VKEAAAVMAVLETKEQYGERVFDMV